MSRQIEKKKTTSSHFIDIHTMGKFHLHFVQVTKNVKKWNDTVFNCWDSLDNLLLVSTTFSLIFLLLALSLLLFLSLLSLSLSLTLSLSLSLSLFLFTLILRTYWQNSWSFWYHPNNYVDNLWMPSYSHCIKFMI